MKNILLLCTILLTGCMSAPVKQKFPDAPDQLMQKCGDLEIIEKPQVKISELMTTVVKNYGKYHECANTVDAWQEWYTKQRDIFKGTNK